MSRTIIQLDFAGKELNRFKQQKLAVDWLQENGHPKASAGSLCLTLQGGRDYAYGFRWKQITEEGRVYKNRIEQRFNDQKPFAVIQYFEKLIGIQTEAVKRYELIMINQNGSKTFSKMTEKDIQVFRSIADRGKIVIDNEHGKVYEFNQ